MSPKRVAPRGDVSARAMAWPVELGYDGEALCARCLEPLRGPDGLRLGGPGSITTVEYFLRAVGDHIEKCTDPTNDVEYYEHASHPLSRA